MHHRLEGMMHNSLSYHGSTTVIQLQSILHYARSITTLKLALLWHRQVSEPILNRRGEGEALPRCYSGLVRNEDPSIGSIQHQYRPLRMPGHKHDTNQMILLKKRGWT